MIDYSDKLTSEFNEAALQIARLNYLTSGVGNLIETGRLIMARWRLDRYAVELWADARRLDKENDTKFTEILEKLDKKISGSIRHRNFYSLYNQLLEKHKILREIQEVAGKGSKFRPADDDFM